MLLREAAQGAFRLLRRTTDFRPGANFWRSNNRPTPVMITEDNSILWLTDDSRKKGRVGLAVRGPDFDLTEPIIRKWWQLKWLKWQLKWH